MKITTQKIGELNVLIGNAKRQSRVYIDADSIGVYKLTKEESKFLKTNINPLKLGEFTKESKETRSTLLALVKLNAIGKDNSVTGYDILKVVDQFSSDKGLILNDANKVGRVLRSLNLSNGDAIEDKDAWANQTSKTFRPQTNYFNINYCYINATVKSPTVNGSKTQRLEASYYLTKAVEVDKLKVRGLIKPSKNKKS